MTDDFGNVRRFIKETCKILGIEPPKMLFDMSAAATDTTLALCSSDGKEIRIRKENPTIDTYFAVAHELRHVWQIRTAPDIWLKDYKTRDELDFEAYNLQPAEIDANAFATIAILNVFRRRPLFHGYPDYIRAKIYDRAREISQEEDE